MADPHLPVLIEPFLRFFSDSTLLTFIDGTLGGGGHAYALLAAHPELNCLYGIDQDQEALAIAKEKLTPFRDRLELIHGNSRNLDTLVSQQVDGIFLDLGVSSMQLDRPEKGFSLYKEGPLDMRMDQTQAVDAAWVLNTLSEQKLGEIFRVYGEEPRWRAAAKAVYEARKKKKLKTTSDLTEVLKPVLRWGGRGSKKIHPMTLVFQAIRIYVNDELSALEEVLPKAIEKLRPQGRLGVISFHSLEDRVVKHVFRKFAVEKKVVILTKKPLIGEEEEIRRNPRARSAKLRFVEKL